MAKKTDFTNEQRKDIIVKALEVVKENKYLAMIGAVAGLQAARGFYANNPGNQALITVLQGVGVSSYLASELEGEAQNAVVGGVMAATGVTAAAQAFSSETDRGQQGLGAALFDILPGERLGKGIATGESRGELRLI